MRPNISITLITPHVTIERYSELTGLAEDTINDMLADGRLPRHRLRKDKKREKVMINIAQLTVDALSNCDIATALFDFAIGGGKPLFLITKRPNTHT